MDKRIRNIFAPSACWSKKQLTAYLDGDLSQEEIYVLEHHATDCRLCYHALRSIIQQGKELAPHIDQLNAEFFSRYTLLHTPQVHLNSIGPVSVMASGRTKPQRKKLNYLTVIGLGLLLISVLFVLYKQKSGANTTRFKQEISIP